MCGEAWDGDISLWPEALVSISPTVAGDSVAAGHNIE